MAIDKISFELIRNTLDTIVDEMTLTMIRTAYSGNIRDGMDFSCAVCDPQGRMVAQGICVALHLGSIPDAIDAVLARFGKDIRPGDVYILNDPYCGGSHLPDIFVFKPVFHDGALLAFLVIVADHIDIGGRVPGGRSVDSTEVYQEGLRIPPIRLQDAGVPVAAVWDLIAQNVRVNFKVLGDLRSCLSACQKAETMLGAATRKFGDAVMRDYFDEILDYSERITRQTLRAIPDGTYTFTDYIDDAVTRPEPIAIHLTLRVQGDEVFFDLTGTSPQVPAAINATLSFTKSAIYAAVRTMLPPDLPNNSGVFRPIHVHAPLGTITNPREPAAVSSRGVTGFRVIDAAMGALAQAAPDRIPASGEGGVSSCRIGGKNPDGSSFIVWDSVTGTWGARPDRDGIDGCGNFAGNLANAPVEVLESESPIRILRYGLSQDTGGPGKYRGGMGILREWEMLAEESVFTMRADRARFAPWGAAGGHPGIKASNILNPQGEGKVLASKLTTVLRKGDRFLHQQASGGGYGDPLERDVGSVLRDWRNERVSLQHARDAYGVVIDAANKKVDEAQTAKLRKSMRARPKEEVPAH